MTVLDFAPHLISFRGDAAQVCHDEVIFRVKVTIERHLVGAGGLGNCLDAHPANAMTME
jgi:hypothetical protein